MELTVNGNKIWYEKAGEGPPILLLHGNGENHLIFRVLTQQLAPCFTVYAVDSRDHGQSGKTPELSYEIMSEDIVLFIEKLSIEKPVLYGFSDGGIIGLMIAAKYPALLSKLIISGANTHPEAIKRGWLRLFKLIYFFNRNKKIRLMLTGPHITKAELEKIKIPVLVMAGEKDMVTEEDTRFIAKAIKNAELKILKNENHASYVINNKRLYNEIIDFLRKE